MTLIFSSIFNSFSKENLTLGVVDQGSSGKSSMLSRMVLTSSAFSADLNSTNSYPSGIVRNQIGYGFVFTVDLRWV